MKFGKETGPLPRAKFHIYRCWNVGLQPPKPSKFGILPIHLSLQWIFCMILYEIISICTLLSSVIFKTIMVLLQYGKVFSTHPQHSVWVANLYEKLSILTILETVSPHSVKFGVKERTCYFLAHPQFCKNRSRVLPFKFNTENSKFWQFFET